MRTLQTELVVLLAVLAILFSITAPATAQDTSTWDAIQDRGTLRIGVT